MNIFSWILHTFTGCPEKDKESVRYGITHCRKCGRIEFVSDCLPIIKRFQTPKRIIKV